jgi:hypothetical protein
MTLNGQSQVSPNHADHQPQNFKTQDRFELLLPSRCAHPEARVEVRVAALVAIQPILWPLFPYNLSSLSKCLSKCQKWLIKSTISLMSCSSQMQSCAQDSFCSLVVKKTHSKITGNAGTNAIANRSIPANAARGTLHRTLADDSLCHFENSSSGVCQSGSVPFTKCATTCCLASFAGMRYYPLLERCKRYQQRSTFYKLNRRAHGLGKLSYPAAESNLGLLMPLSKQRHDSVPAATSPVHVIFEANGLNGSPSNWDVCFLPGS